MRGRVAGALVERLRLRPGAGRAERRVAEELRLHCEMLFEEYLGRGLTAEEARRAAAERFGDFESAYARCVEVAKRSGPAARLLRASLSLSLTAGVWLRVCFTDAHVAALGNVLVLTAVLGHLLLCLRRSAAPVPIHSHKNSPRLG